MKRANLALMVVLALGVGIAGCGDDGGSSGDADLDQLYTDDTADRVDSQLSCGEIQVGIQATIDGKVSATQLLPRSVWLALAEPTELGRSEAAQRYILAVLDAVWRERISFLMAVYDPQMTRAEYRAIVKREWTRRTLVPLSTVQSAITSYCTGTMAAGPPVGPTAQGFVCPKTPRPDCAADPPSEPWGCPPPAKGDCPDCPGLEEAEADLKRLEELFEAAKQNEQFEGVIDALLDALLDAIESGDPPTPASLALGVVSAVLGPDYPGLTFYVDLVVSTVEGFTVGGPVGGMAALAWALLTGWGDFVDDSERLGDIEDARSRLNRLRQWCEDIGWADKQAKCEEFEQNLFDKRTAECTTAQAQYQTDLMDWMASQAACDDERAAADAANDAASSMTARLQGSAYAFTAEAFELCCDEPLGAPKCPPDGSAIDPVPFPPWSDPLQNGPLVVVDGGVKKLRPGADHTSDPFYATVPNAVSMWAAPGHAQILVGTSDGKIFDIAGGGDFTLATPWATFAPNALLTNIDYDYTRHQWIITDLQNGDLHMIETGGDYTIALPWAHGLSFPVATITRDDGKVLVSENGKSRVVDATAGGDLSSAPSYADLGSFGPQHFAYAYDASNTRRLLLGAADGVGAGAIFDFTADPPSGAALSTPFITGVFNPSGIAYDYSNGVLLINSFNPAGGETYDATGASAGTDLSGATPFATGLTNPNGIAFAPTR